MCNWDYPNLPPHEKTGASSVQVDLRGELLHRDPAFQWETLWVWDYWIHWLIDSPKKILIIDLWTYWLLVLLNHCIQKNSISWWLPPIVKPLRVHGMVGLSQAQATQDKFTKNRTRWIVVDMPIKTSILQGISGWEKNWAVEHPWFEISTPAEGAAAAA